MAVYTPEMTITNKVLGNGAGNITTWQAQASSEVIIVRTINIQTATAARTVTLQTGSASADTAAQYFMNAYALTANVPFVRNMWLAVADTHYINGFANATDITGFAAGYSYA